MNWAFEQTEAKGPAKLVLVNLVFHWNQKERAAWPGLDRITRETGLHRRTAVRAIAKLEKLNLIEKAKREGPHGSNRYTLKIPAEFDADRNGKNATPTKIVEMADLPVEMAKSALVGVADLPPKPLSEPLSLNSDLGRGAFGDGNGKGEKKRVRKTSSTEPSNEPSIGGNKESEAVRLTNLLNSLIARNVPKRTPPTKSKLTGWIETCREMHQRDGHSWKDIEETIRWCQENSFWRKVILSMEDLRHKWNKLQAGMGAGEAYSGPPRPEVDCPSIPVL